MPSETEILSSETEIRPFRVDMSDEAIADLRRRLAVTRWPSKELVQDGSQGVQLVTLQELARYWAADYDWRTCEARLNALPQFTTEIDGVEIHFIHVKSAHENALPLIITHGWPGSVIEMLGVVGPLTDPTAHGGRAEDAFDLVLPSLPGYGLSGEPAEVGWDPGRVGQAWAELMRRLGYTRYVAQGGDQGAGVTDAMGRQAPDGLLGVHFNFLDAAPRELLMAALNLRLAFSEEDRAQFGKFTAILRRGYIAEMGEHPQTIGYPLVDSHLAWRPGCWTTTRTATRRSPMPFSTGAALGRPHPGPHPRQHHAVLADEYRDLVSAAVLGVRTKCNGCVQGAASSRLAPGGFHGVPRRDLPGPAPLGEEGLPQPDLFQRGRRGRSLRRLGRAATVFRRAPRGVPVTALNTAHTRGLTAATWSTTT
jgi:pimeloyl-ACP methyl ester carboxylesterase